MIHRSNIQLYGVLIIFKTRKLNFVILHKTAYSTRISKFVHIKHFIFLTRLLYSGIIHTSAPTKHSTSIIKKKRKYHFVGLNSTTNYVSTHLPFVSNQVAYNDTSNSLFVSFNCFSSWFVIVCFCYLMLS